MGLDYSGYDGYSKYYIYNFDDAAESEDVLIGVRIKGCGHGVWVTDCHYNFFRSVSGEGYSRADYDDYISKDTDFVFCP